MWTAGAVALLAISCTAPVDERRAPPADSPPSKETGWRRLPDAPLSPLLHVSLVWTGREAVLWGTTDPEGDDVRAEAAAFAPATSRWSRVPPGPLLARFGQSTVWTGTEMLVWGGAVVEQGRPRPRGDGAAFDPRPGRWRRLEPAPLAPRLAHTAVWTGEEMILWGGTDGAETFSDGAVYDPSTGSWSTLPQAPLDGRVGHAALWTGEVMLVWGGRSATGTLFADGAAYDPVTEQWMKLPAGPLTARAFFSMVWTGKEALFWGGTAADGELFGDGASYRPDTGDRISVSPPG